MTLPTFWPLFWSGMCLLERRFGCAAEAVAAPPAEGSESSEASPLPIHQGKRLSVLRQRLHPGGVIEASDVRGNERGKHREQYPPEARRYRSSRTGPPRRERFVFEVGIRWNAFRRSSAADVRRSIVSRPANAPVAACARTGATETEPERTAEEARMLPKPTAATATATAAAAGARRRSGRRRKRPISIARSNCSSGVARSAPVSPSIPVRNSRQ